MFKNIFSFEGRIRRTEFGLTMILYYVSAAIFSFIMADVLIDDSTIVDLIVLAFYLVLFWIMLAQGAKRCHDVGNSGWFQLIPFYIFWMLFEDSKYGENKYGPNPKGIGNYDYIEDIGKDLHTDKKDLL